MHTSSTSSSLSDSASPPLGLLAGRDVPDRPAAVANAYLWQAMGIPEPTFPWPRPGPVWDFPAEGFSPRAFVCAVHNHTRAHHDALREQMAAFEDWLEQMTIFLPSGTVTS